MCKVDRWDNFLLKMIKKRETKITYNEKRKKMMDMMHQNPKVSSERERVRVLDSPPPRLPDPG